jgi:hypothetical protein
VKKIVIGLPRPRAMGHGTLTESGDERLEPRLGVGPCFLHCTKLLLRGLIHLAESVHGVALGVGLVQLHYCQQVRQHTYYYTLYFTP